MLLQQLEDCLPMPAGVAKLQRNLEVRRYLREEVRQASMIIRKGGRKLHQQHPTPHAQVRETLDDAAEPALRRVQALPMGQQPWCFDTEAEVFRQAALPGPQGGIRRPAVVAAVEFNRLI